MPLNLVFTQAGTFTIDDNGIPGDNISVIRDGNGVVIFSFAHPADALGLTVNVPGVNLIINFTDSMAAADFSIGSLTDPAITPDSIVMKSVRTTGDVTLVSNGAITEGGADAAADIVAGSLIMSAVSGVGTSGNAIETQTSFIEAETATGGINLRNTGSVQIGGLTDQVNGLDVLTSGNLNLTAIGSIFLSDIDLDPANNPLPPAQSVHGGDISGNVTLTASGFTSDIFTNTDTDAVTAPRGNITLIAGRDVAIGTIGVDFDNDVRANGTVRIDAGRDFLLDGFSDLSSDAFFNNTGGDVIINTGRNIHMRNIAGDDATITASGTAGANVLFTTGFSGAVILDAPSANAVSSSSGDVIVAADRMLIGAASGITANTGVVTLRPATEGRAMFLGSASDAALAVELADSELDRVFTNQLILGGDNTGLVRIIAPFSPANTPDVSIRSATDISIESSFSAIDAIKLSAGNDISQLAATLITAGGAFSAFVDDAQDDSNAGGIGIFRGAITGSSVTMNGNLDPDTLEGTDGDDVLKGNGGADTLRGRGGADVLDGGIGADQMTGGLGDDEFVVDVAGDVVIEAVGEGKDTVKTGISFTLPANVEDLTLTGSSDRKGNGNSLDNVIIGNSGNNTINGLDGADTMIGGLGNDIFFAGSPGDVVTEAAGAGTDLVKSSVSFTLGPNVENLILTGVAASGTGNTLANILTGNGAANTLNGGTGADTMVGGLGNDTYVVDNAGDVVTEAGSAGADTVQSTISFTLAATFENLTLTGAAAISGTGNAATNTLVGNTGNNSLSGLGGNDQISGGTGIDNLFGGAGNDDLTGGAGADRFRFDAVLNAATNVDDILDFSPVDDTMFLDRDIFTSFAADGLLASSAFVNGTAAGDANDRIIYNSATGNIFYDADGTAGGAQILFATVVAGTVLTNADFFAYT